MEPVYGSIYLEKLVNKEQCGKPDLQSHIAICGASTSQVV